MDAKGRDLIQRLAQRLNMHEREMFPCSEAPIIAEARAYLAALKPEAGPTDDDLDELCDVFNCDSYAKPAILRALELWGHREPASVAEQPKPVTLTVAPTKEQVDEWATRLADETRDGDGQDYWIFDLGSIDLHEVVIRVLERWGNHAPQPIPISERLPKPEDCDDDHLWLWDPDWNGWMLQHRHWTTDPDGDATYWLPHWAISVPQEEVDQ